MVELEVFGIVMQLPSEDEKQRLRDAATTAGAVIVDSGARYQVRLKERDGDRVLTFGIAEFEARAIEFATQGLIQPRPMTHDFICNLLGVLDDVSATGLVLWYDILRNEAPLNLQYSYEDGGFDQDQPTRQLTEIKLFTGLQEPPGEGPEDLVEPILATLARSAAAAEGADESTLTRPPDSGPPVVGVRRPACWAGGQDHDEASPSYARADRPQAARG